MHLEHSSHLFGQTIIREHFPNEYTQLLFALENTELPLRPAGPFTTGRGGAPKRQSRRVAGGEKRKLLLPANMPRLNEIYDEVLRAEDWTPQPYAADDVFAVTGSQSKGDFAKNGVFVEVEFGNTASLFRDLFKFQVASRERQGEVAVLITATRKLMKFHDSGVATYEKVVSMLPYMRIGVQMPIWIVGIEPVEWEPVRQRYKEMFATATENGDKCITFEDAFGADLPVEEDVTVEEGGDEPL
jgi:hypothetical protein